MIIQWPEEKSVTLKSGEVFTIIFALEDSIKIWKKVASESIFAEEWDSLRIIENKIREAHDIIERLAGARNGKNFSQNK